MDVRLPLAERVISLALEANSRALRALDPSPADGGVLLAEARRGLACWALLRPLVGRERFRAARARLANHIQALTDYRLALLATALAQRAARDGRARSARAFTRLADLIELEAPRPATAAGVVLRTDSQAWLELPALPELTDEELLRYGVLRWYRRGRGRVHRRSVTGEDARRRGAWAHHTAAHFELLGALAERRRASRMLAARLSRQVDLAALSEHANAALAARALGRKDTRRVRATIAREAGRNAARVQKLARRVYADQPKLVLRELRAALAAPDAPRRVVLGACRDGPPVREEAT